MKARFHDGLTAAVHTVEVTVDGETLAFEVQGQAHRWSLCAVETERVGEAVRVAPGAQGAARLVIDATEWAAATVGSGLERRRMRREMKLVIGLTVFAAAIALFVFVGMPLASGPLARHTPPDYERRMGESFEAQLGVALKPCKGALGQAALSGLGQRMEGAAASPFSFRVQAVEAPMVNAFALPGGAIMVTDDLIKMAHTPDELAAVIAHEAAHVERRHVMQAVWRSLGLGLALDAVVGGGSGAGQQAVILAGSFTDLRFSRDAESEADARGQALLRALGLSSQGMAPFFERLAAKGQSQTAAEVQELLSSHPDSLRRARESRVRARPGAPAFTPAEWAAIKATCSGQDRPLRLPRLGGKRTATLANGSLQPASGLE